MSRGRNNSRCNVVLIQQTPLSPRSGPETVAMDFVIPVALGVLLTEMDIVTAAELNRDRAKALASPKLRSLGLVTEGSRCSNCCC